MSQVSQFVSGLILGVVFAYVYENLPLRKIFKKDSLIINGYKLHHSLYGAVLVLISFIVDGITFSILLSVGIGIIVEHYLTGGGLDFITKQKNKSH